MLFLGHKTLLTLLLSAVLAIGGCLPCQQLIGGKTPKKSCCNSKGECQRPGPDSPSNKACNLKLTETQSEPQQHVDQLLGADLTGDVGADVTVASACGIIRPELQTVSFDSSPPPLFLLNASFLI